MKCLNMILAYSLFLRLIFTGLFVFSWPTPFWNRLQTRCSVNWISARLAWKWLENFQFGTSFHDFLRFRFRKVRYSGSASIHFSDHLCLNFDYCQNEDDSPRPNSPQNLHIDHHANKFFMSSAECQRRAEFLSSRLGFETTNHKQFW